MNLGLGPDADFVGERAAAGARHASAAGAIEELETQIARSSDLERQVLATEAELALARRLSDDLKPGKFLAFLLEEERAELAQLGSGLFETLTDGNYRFAADDSFDILDLNAADRTRKADSLSGGETFLASLALALALAEMVARGGGRLDAFFLDEGFGSLDPEHLDRAMAGIERLVADDDRRLVVLVSHVAEMREAIEDLSSSTSTTRPATRSSWRAPRAHRFVAGATRGEVVAGLTRSEGGGAGAHASDVQPTTRHPTLVMRRGPYGGEDVPHRGLNRRARTADTPPTETSPSRAETNENEHHLERRWSR